MASSSRPLDKNILEANGRLKLEWDAYFSRIESEVASLAAQITGGGVPSSRQVISGAGLTGGGDLSADRTLEVGEGTGITVAADSISTNDAEIVHDNLSGFVADEHVAHSGVTLTAGAGLTGGGDISASRSFAVGAGTGITVNADDVAITAGGVGTTQLADEGVTLAKLEHAAAYTLLMRNAGTAGDPAYAKISALTNAASFSSGDKLMIEESSGELRKIDYDDLPGGVSAGAWTMVTKAADQNRSSTTTLANDSELLVPLSANTTYVIRGDVFWDTPAAADFKYSFSGPSSPTRVRIGHFSLSPDDDFLGLTDEAYNVSTPQAAGANTFGFLRFSAVIVNGANSGNFAFQWAQNTSSGSNTTVRAGSYIEYRSL